MNLSSLQRFATTARRDLLRSVADRLDIVLADGSPDSLSRPAMVDRLRAAEREMGRKKLVDTVAYTWFNRFCALRFMDAHGYTDVRVVSPAPGSSRPELLAEAMAGSLEPSLPAEVKARVTGLLNGTIRSREPHSEAYRILLLAACNAWSASLPFLFEKLDDWTELLLPADLLSPHSVLAAVSEAMDDDSCANVEIVGWLYQFYITERKDEVFKGFKNGKKAAKEDIPAATELFTPRWIVRFLVQNSLGRLWLRAHPESRLRDRMEYFVPDDPDAPKPMPNPALRPEDLRMCDPCCGSGHMLVQGFDLLFDIYLECGYGAAEIPKLVLENNLVGLDLDPRAASLSAFALAMKAREHDSRFLAPGRGAIPRIHALLPVSFGEGDLDQLEDALGKNAIPRAAWRSLGLFGEADNLGSLIEPEPCDWPAIREVLKAFDTDNIFLRGIRDRALAALALAEALAPQRYHIVVTNPPYMKGNNMNAELRSFAKKHYPISNADLFSMFIERCHELVERDGFVSMVTMQSWMFLDSYKKLRVCLLDEDTMMCMAHLGAKVMHIGFGTSATIWQRSFIDQYRTPYCYVEFSDIDAFDKPVTFPPKNIRNQLSKSGFFKVSIQDIKRIPGFPFAYWASDIMRNLFSSFAPVSNYVTPSVGIQTGDNERFVRFWWEPIFHSICFNAQSVSDTYRKEKFFPYNKGGDFRKWEGNNDLVVDWQNDGFRVKDHANRTGHHWQEYQARLKFQRMVTWTRLSSGLPGFRYKSTGYLSDMAGFSIYPSSWESDGLSLLGLLNSTVGKECLDLFSPTMNFMIGQILSIPYADNCVDKPIVEQLVHSLIEHSRTDWDSYETSWDFKENPLVAEARHFGEIMLSDVYDVVRINWAKATVKMRELEIRNNEIFIKAYGLEGELSPDVPWNEISLTCNPWYRYRKKKKSKKAEEADESEASECEFDKPEIEGVSIDLGELNAEDFPHHPVLEARLRADTAKELISYAVGCMMGRYSLDRPGLAFADAGGTLEDYHAKLREAGVDTPRFEPDEDGILPILDADWFEDDIVSRFHAFLRAAFGEANFHANVAWLEEALGKDLRTYFVKNFYTDHVQRYQNRPIYWLFSSRKGAFQALVYLHRYRPDTPGRVLAYLRSHLAKVKARVEALDLVAVDPDASRGAKKTAQQEKEKLTRAQSELENYERDVLYPLSTERPALDLDDGVKANYPKLGAALKKIF